MGTEIKNAVKLMASIEKNYPNWDKCNYFHRVELKKEFYLVVDKSETYFRSLIEALQAWGVLGKISESEYPFNLKNYENFKKKFKV